jgi:hypothetical protein
MLEPDNTPVLFGFRFALLYDLGFNPQGIADEYRIRELHLIHAQIANRGTQGGIADGQTDDQAQRKITIYQYLTKLRSLGEFRIDMQWLRIVSHGTEKQIVCFCYGSVGHMLKQHPHL